MPSDNAKDNSAFDSSMIEVKKDMAYLNDTGNNVVFLLIY